jgi:protein involved in polysaccharide export with SLBB domain
LTTGPDARPASAGAIGDDTTDAQRRIELANRISRGNPYELDDLGQLNLPGLAAIRLAGLSIDEATVRIGAEQSLSAFSVGLTLLPLEPVGIQALKPFGYNLFERQPTAMATSQSVSASSRTMPVPQNYVVGPGDVLTVQLFGSQNVEYRMTVSRDGTVGFPQLGAITLAGLTFEEARELISGRVSQEIPGVRANVTLSELRSISIVVSGDVERPGAHFVSGYATITSALFQSRGISTIGSLRNITLMREGSSVATLDLYDVLLRGDTRNDARLQSGDVVLVPPVGTSGTVFGVVVRAAV